MHFLENSGVQSGRRLRALVDELAAGASTEAALEAVFPADELPELDRARREDLAAPRGTLRSEGADQQLAHAT